MAFDFSGLLPQFKALISSSQLRNRFNDIKTYLATTFNPAGITLPSADGTANQALVADGDLSTSWSNVVRSNVDLEHDGGNGSAGQVLQSDGDGTTSWATVGTLTDGDKGDITVATSGTIWTIDSDAVTTSKIADDNVTFDKIQNLSPGNLLGRYTSGSGSTEEVTLVNTITTDEGHFEFEGSKINLRGLRTQAFYNSHDAYSAGSQNEIENTTTETSILGNSETDFHAEPGGNTWPSVKASTSNDLDTYRIRAYGSVGTTGTPTMQFKIKLGSTAVLDTGAITSPVSGLSGLFEIDAVITLDTSLGVATTRVLGNGGMRITDSSTRITYTLADDSTTPVTGVDMSTDQNFGATFQWGTASASNTLFLSHIVIERVL